MEAANRVPKGEVLAQLIDLGFSADWLVTGAGQMLRDAPPAPAAELDEQLLAEAIRIVEAWLAQRGLVLAADRKARVVAAIYGLAIEDVAEGRTFDPRRAGHILKLVG